MELLFGFVALQPTGLPTPTYHFKVKIDFVFVFVFLFFFRTVGVSRSSVRLRETHRSKCVTSLTASNWPI